jgi:hypothetical protein
MIKHQDKYEKAYKYNILFSPSSEKADNPTDQDDYADYSIIQQS